MRRPHKAGRAALACALATLLVSAATAGTAGAAPLWYFDGEVLEGSEKMTNGDPGSYFTIPGITFGCQPLPLEATIENSAGKGVASVIGLPFGTCFSDSPHCPIEAFEATALPWSSNLATVGKGSYLIVKGFKVEFLFGDEECPLYGIPVVITGTAGGLVDNEDEEIVFNSVTLKATGTELKALGQKIEWNAGLELKAIGPHRGQALSAQ